VSDLAYDSVPPASAANTAEEGERPLFTPAERLAVYALLSVLLFGIVLRFGVEAWRRSHGLRVEHSQANNGFRLNINAAEWHDLVLLPGIGVKKARKIVEYREEHGNFQRPDDLRAVDGITERDMTQLSGLIEAGPTDRPPSNAKRQ